MRKKLILTLIVITILLMVLVGCAVTDHEVEYPIAWNAYVDEIANYYYRAVRDAYSTFSLSFNLEMYHTIDGEQSRFLATFKLVQDTEDPNNSALEVAIKANNADVVDREVFYLACNNSNTYLKARNIDTDYGSLQYKFENTPIFDMFDLSLTNPFTAKAEMIKMINKVATGCVVNSDKSIYTLSVKLEDVVNEFSKEIDKILSVIPQPIVSQINEIFNCDVSDWNYILVNTEAKVNCEIVDNKLQNVRVTEITGHTDDSSRVDSLNITDISVIKSVEGSTLATDITTGKDSYIPTKLATFMLNGSISLVDDTMRNTAIKYDYKLNSSLDILKLAANDFNFSQLDDRNYFHFRLSHICNNTCTDYCSVDNGNKLSASKGAVLDIAFSPNDFGTHYVYVAVGIKQILGMNLLSSMAGSSASLATLALPEYVLLTLDTTVFEQQSDITVDGLLKPLFGLLSNIDIGKESSIIDIDKILKLLNVNPSPAVASIIDSLITSNGIRHNKLVMTYDTPSFGYVTNYDIKHETLVIIDRNLSETKNFYKSYIIGSISPSVRWEYKDYSTINQGGVERLVHGIYKDKDNVIYDTTKPISPQEAGYLSGNYVKYDYTDTLGEVKSDGMAKIISTSTIDYSIIGEYQPVTLKLQLPSNWLGLIGGVIGDNTLNNLYTKLETNICLTELQGMPTIERTHMEEGVLVTSYQLSRLYGSPKLLLGKITLTYTNGEIKTIAINGSSNAIRTVSSATTTNYYLDKTGSFTVQHNYAGYKETFNIEVLEPDDIYLEPFKKANVYKSRTELSYSTLQLYEVIAVYADKKNKIPLTLDSCSIDGQSLANDGRYWWSYTDTNSLNSGDNDDSIENRVVFFLADGMYSVRVAAYGLVATTDIEVTSRVIDGSKYALNDTTNPSNNALYVGFRKSHTYNVANSYHGAYGAESLKWEIRVHRYYVTSGGADSYSQIAMGENTFNLSSFSYRGAAFDYIGENPAVSLPSSIIGKYNFSFYISFANAGRYKLEIRLKGVGVTLLNSKDIYVYNLPMTPISY